MGTDGTSFAADVLWLVAGILVTIAVVSAALVWWRTELGSSGEDVAGAASATGGTRSSPAIDPDAGDPVTREGRDSW